MDDSRCELRKMDNFTEMETNNNDVSGRNDPYLEIELYLKKVTDEIGAVFDQWQREAALKQQYPDVIKPDPKDSCDNGLTLTEVQEEEEKKQPLASSPPLVKIPPKVPPKRPNLLLPDLLQQQQQKDNCTATSSPANTPTSPLLQPREVDTFLKKVQTTILGDNLSSDAGTQTPLSRSSSVAWLSSSHSSLGGGSAGADSTSPFSSSEETFLSSHGANETAADTSSPERESCDSNSGNGSAGDLLEGWGSSLPPIAKRDGIPSWKSTASDIDSRVKKRQKIETCQLLHSPSSISSLTGSALCPKMGAKSSSAPVLRKDADQDGQDGADDEENQRNYPQMRSHSEQHVCEIEAAEACRWMRAAGFPQYAQMYVDNQFPVELQAVQKDHPFLDRDALRALFRRLQALNKCARLHRSDAGPAAAINTHQHDNYERGDDTLTGADSDEEVECALSDNWMFLHQSRRWSRILPLNEPASSQHRPAPLADDEAELPECDTQVSGADADDLSDPTGIQMPLQRQHSSSLPPDKFKTTSSEMETALVPSNLNRVNSEKLRERTKAFLRRVESVTSRRQKSKVGCKNDDIPIIGAPQVVDVDGMQERMKVLNCVDLNSPEALEAASQKPNAGPYTNANNNLLFPEKEDLGAHSDSECIDRSSAWMDTEDKKEDEPEGKKKKKDAKRAKKLQTKDQRSATLNLDTKIKSNKNKLKHGKSDNGGLADVSPEREESRTSFYEQFRRSAFSKRHKELSKGSSEGSIHEEDPFPSPSKKSVTRWHCFGRSSAMRRPSFVMNVEETEQTRRGFPLASLSCGQLIVLRQVAMLKLTGLMETHSPSLRSTGFSWELPKFMRKTGKSTVPKEGAVFGVSLHDLVQTTGQALPQAIQTAIQHLSLHALDRQGIFRRPGVKSRIQKLRQHLTELAADEPLEFALGEQQDYDVADMVKQFFRDLPETLMTTKLSDTCIAIFQHVPQRNRYEAMKWVMMLLPDHHREVLQLLLSFLGLVASHSRSNQMTASNLAVCFAPSLFYHSSAPLTPTTSIDLSGGSTGGSGSGGGELSRGGSPRARGSKRAKLGSGSPDARELAESRAGHDCLHFLINNHEELVHVNQELFNSCHFTSMEESVPLPLDQLGADLGQDWRAYMQSCINGMHKELKERSRGWVSVNCHHPQVELSHKKVDDGHPLRLWKVSTEVEAPPAELLNRILRERIMWDPHFATSRVLAKFEPQSEVFQYATYSMLPLPHRDYCVIRTWKSDLPRGGCVLVETSVEFGQSKEPLLPGCVRGIVLASRYLIEHCGSGRSKIIHLSRIDTKGRGLEWYNKCYGQMSALQLSRIRSSFTQYLTAEGPESKV
ncbi:rho GTPase-activating protein 7 [Cloeon dipterum]|uniref:rho GTPase-activating protein 7 n=1 Tax=Cloeon dipterum TaxID=197152 RepID=UPI00322070FE